MTPATGVATDEDRPAPIADQIDAEALLERYSADELNEAAEDYFARLPQPSWYHLQKPLASYDEAPILLAHVGAVLAVGELAHGMQVVDFGAGSGWTSRMLAQLGCSVIAMDVAPSALRLGRELLALQPLVGEATPPTFLAYDGHDIELPDASVDRVVVIDAFHHFPNQEHLLAEFHRILRPGGMAILSDGGPDHSRTAQSQSEMRNFVVIERDTDPVRVAEVAGAAGFATVQSAVYSPTPILLTPVAMEQGLRDGFNGLLDDAARRFHVDHRLLLLRKAGAEAADSRRRDRLDADIAVEILDGPTGPSGRATITNTGVASWRPSGGAIGAVNLGAHARAADGTLLDLDALRVPLSARPRTIEPGETVVVDFALPPLPAGTGALEFDLVSEGVAWFGDVGTPTCIVTVPDRA